MAYVTRIPSTLPFWSFPRTSIGIRTFLSTTSSSSSALHHFTEHLQPCTTSRHFHSTKSEEPSRRKPKKNRIKEECLQAHGIETKESAEAMPPVLLKVKELMEAASCSRVQSNEWSSMQKTIVSFQGFGSESCFLRNCFNGIRPDLTFETSTKEQRVVDDDVVKWTCKVHPIYSGHDPLPVPKSDMLHGFSLAGSIDSFPLATNALGSYIFPFGCKRSLSLAFPFEAIEAKSFDGDMEYAKRQNLRTSGFILYPWYRLIALSENAIGWRIAERLQRFGILTGTISPHGASLCGHWMRVDVDGSLSILYRCLKQWRFPDEVEEASKCMVAASKHIHGHAKCVLFSDLKRIETRLSNEYEPGSGCDPKMFVSPGSTLAPTDAYFLR